MALTRPRYSQIYDTDYKQSCRLATTADVGNLIINTSITNTVDSKTVVAGDRILVKDQSDGKQNGIYRVLTVGTGSNGSWTRDHDADSQGVNKISSGMMTTITDGTINAYSTWKLITPDPITVGSTSLSFINQTAQPGGSGNSVQFNNYGSIFGTPYFTFDQTSNLLTVPNATISSGSNSTAFNNGALVVTGGVGISGDLRIQGNLYVANVISTITQTLVVQDPLLYLSSNSAYPYNYDIGFYSHYIGGAANTYVHTGFVRDNNDKTWYLFSNAAEPILGQVSVTDANIAYDPLITGTHTIYGSVFIKSSAGINTDQSVFNLVNTNATQINFGSGASSLYIGAGTGTTTFNSYTASTTQLSGAVAVNGGLGVGSNLNVGGSMVPSCTHKIYGNLSLLGSASLSVNGNISVGTLTIPGALHTVSGNVSVAGNITTTGNLNVGGNIYVNSVQVPTIIQMMTYSLAF